MVVIWSLYSIAFVYFMLDAYSSSILFDYGASELNPIMRYWISIFDDPLIAMVTVKLALMVILAVLLIIYCKKERRRNGRCNRHKGLSINPYKIK